MSEMGLTGTGTDATTASGLHAENSDVLPAGSVAVVVRNAAPDVAGTFA
jgi:hypothetical protein